jgi:hypothetical protein
MRRYFVILLFSGICLITNAQSSKDIYLTKPLSAEAIQNVEASTTGGSISVSGGNGSDARIEVYVKDNRGGTLTQEEMKSRIDADYELNITVNDHKLTAIVKQKHQNINWNRSVSVSYKIYVPENVSTDLSTSGGSISLKNLSGTEDFSTSGGSLEVDHLGGKVKGRTSGGSIDLTNSKDDIDLNTSGGSIEASDCMGKIKLSTSGGSLKLSRMDGDVNATTSGGSAEADNITGTLSIHTSGSGMKLQDLACSLDASTSGSDIEVTMKSLGKYVKISNAGGDIDLKMPRGNSINLDLYARKIRTDSLNNFSGSQDGHHLYGTLNGGGVPVTVDAGNGAIYLSWK